jgi:hypothetical protein
MNNAKELELINNPVAAKHDFLNSFCSEDISQLAVALSKAQSEMPSAIKNRTNPHFRSLYADYDSIWEACRVPLTANGLSISHMPMRFEKEWVLLTLLFHKSGQWIRNMVPLFLEGQKSQALGSAMTYMKRYGLSAIIAIPTDEDDDGNAADERVVSTAKPSTAGPLWKELLALGGNRDLLIDIIKENQMVFSESMPPEKFHQLKQFYREAIKNRSRS